MDLFNAVEIVVCILLIGAGVFGIVRSRGTRGVEENKSLVKASEAGIATGAALIAGTLFTAALGLAVSSQALSHGGRPVPPKIELDAMLAIAAFVCGGFTLIGWSRAARGGTRADAIVMLLLSGLVVLLFGAAAILDAGQAVLILAGGRTGLLPAVMKVMIDALIFGLSVRAVLFLVRALTSRLGKASAGSEQASK